MWLDIGNADLDPSQQGSRLGEFVVAYDADLLDAVPAVIDAQTELSRRRGSPKSTQKWATQCLQWSNDNRVALEAGLALARQAAF
jgi:hypothetical protein